VRGWRLGDRFGQVYTNTVRLTVKKIGKEKDGHTNRPIGRPEKQTTGRPIDRQTGNQKDIQTGRPIETYS
jgi:hypothetical protein